MRDFLAKWLIHFRRRLRRAEPEPPSPPRVAPAARKEAPRRPEVEPSAAANRARGIRMTLLEPLDDEVAEPLERLAPAPSEARAGPQVGRTGDPSQGPDAERIGLRQRQPSGQPSSHPDAALAEPPPATFDVEPARPTRRLPVPVLWILDDGQETGESVRIRATPLVIGRTQGQVTVPHDRQVSERHAEITWSDSPAGRALYLRDLQSQTGTLVKVLKARIRHAQQIQLGSRRYRFDETGQLVELTPGGDGRRFRWEGAEIWIGREPQPGTVVIADDPTLSPRHARLYRDAKGRWYIEDADSLNGTWLAIEQVQVVSKAEFLLGEQRFRLLLP